jgi:hypothetical protein
VKAALKVALIIFAAVVGVCAIAALLTMMGIGVSGDDHAVIQFGHHTIDADDLWDEEWIWAPLVWIVITLAYVVAAIAVVGSLGFVAVTLLAVAFMLAAPFLLMAGAGYWLWKRGHGTSAPPPPTSPPSGPPAALA